MADRRDLERLLARVALRDRAAFAELYRLTSAKLFGVALRILPQRSEAEDVLQIAYLNVWTHAARFDASVASPITWMAAIARNAAIDRRRSRAAKEAKRIVEPAPSDDGPERGIETIADDRPSPEALAVRSGEVERLGRCMDELGERQATVMRRAYLGGLTYREIGDELAVPENTIKTWVRRSLAALRECMNRDEVPNRDEAPKRGEVPNRDGAPAAIKAETGTDPATNGAGPAPTERASNRPDPSPNGTEPSPNGTDPAPNGTDPASRPHPPATQGRPQ